MGPSGNEYNSAMHKCYIKYSKGAGKSTLLDILAQKEKRGEVSGMMHLNDQFSNVSKIRSKIG
jgi:ABC-type molybdenum transport system ATPase subunit/photorepair protein PhrA